MLRSRMLFTGVVLTVCGCGSMNITTTPQVEGVGSQAMEADGVSQTIANKDLATYAGGLEPSSHAAYVTSEIDPERVEYSHSRTVRLQRSMLEDLQEMVRSRVQKEMLGIWFFTLDGGQTWIPSAPPTQEGSQAIFCFDSDGHYGFRYVSVPEGPVKGLITPDSGILPQFLVIVDTRAPRIRWMEEEDADRVPGKLLLRWETHDENLEAHPVRIEYRSRAGEVWRLLGENLPSKGQLQWKVPVPQRQKYRFRLTVVDRVGLASRDVSSPRSLPVDESGPAVAGKANQPTAE